MSENLAARLHKHTLARCSQPSAIVEDKSSRRSRGTYTEEEATPSYLQDTATILGLERSRGAFCRWAAPIKDACPNPAKILWDREIVHPTSATAAMASRLPTRTKVKDDGDESSPPPPPSRGGVGGAPATDHDRKKKRAYAAQAFEVGQGGNVAAAGQSPAAGQFGAPQPLTSG